MKDFLKYNKLLWTEVEKSQNSSEERSRMSGLLKTLEEAEKNLNEKRGNILIPDNDVVRNMKGLIRSS